MFMPANTCALTRATFNFSKKNWGTLIRACALIRSNTVINIRQFFCDNQLMAKWDNILFAKRVKY